MRRIAVIPARGGSKRIPRKNIADLAGRPMLAYTVDAALGSGLFDRIVVSTDDEEIAAVATASGCDVEVRPRDLSDDLTPVSAATVHALEEDNRRHPGTTLVCQLMANCPLRTAADIVDSHASFVDSDARSQISVAAYGWQPPWWAAQLDEWGRMEPLFPDVMGSRSQDLPALVCPTGAVWWSLGETLLQEGTFHVQDRTGWEMPWVNAFDIDEPGDLALAEVLMRARLADEL